MGAELQIEAVFVRMARDVAEALGEAFGVFAVSVQRSSRVRDSVRRGMKEVSGRGLGGGR